MCVVVCGIFFVCYVSYSVGCLMLVACCLLLVGCSLWCVSCRVKFVVCCLSCVCGLCVLFVVC